VDFNQIKLNTRFCPDLLGNEQNKKFFNSSYLLTWGTIPEQICRFVAMGA
jgi:hypothetical protein